MNYWKFLLYTTIGAGCWNCILAALGWYLHSIVPENELNDKISEYSHQIQLFIIVAFIIAVGYFVIKRMMSKRGKSTK